MFYVLFSMFLFIRRICAGFLAHKWNRNKCLPLEYTDRLPIHSPSLATSVAKAVAGWTSCWSAYTAIPCDRRVSPLRWSLSESRSNFSVHFPAGIAAVHTYEAAWRMDSHFDTTTAHFFLFVGGVFGGATSISGCFDGAFDSVAAHRRPFSSVFRRTSKQFVQKHTY